MEVIICIYPALSVVIVFPRMSLDLNFCPLPPATSQNVVELQGLLLAVAISPLSVHFHTLKKMHKSHINLIYSLSHLLSYVSSLL